MITVSAFSVVVAPASTVVSVVVSRSSMTPAMWSACVVMTGVGRPPAARLRGRALALTSRSLPSVLISSDSDSVSRSWSWRL